MTFSGHSCSQQSAFKQICFTSHIKKNQKFYLCHKEDCTKAFKPLLHGRGILKPLEHAGSHRLFPGGISIALLSSLILVYLDDRWPDMFGVFRIEIPDGLVDGLVRRLHLVFQLVLPVLIRAVSPLSVEVNPLLLC